MPDNDDAPKPAESRHTDLQASSPAGPANLDSEEQAIYQELVDERSAYLFCDSCGHYPIYPVHGHFVCPDCRMPTKCCEGGPLDA